MPHKHSGNMIGGGARLEAFGKGILYEAKKAADGPPADAALMYADEEFSIHYHEPSGLIYVTESLSGPRPSDEVAQRMQFLSEADKLSILEEDFYFAGEYDLARERYEGRTGCSIFGEFVEPEEEIEDRVSVQRRLEELDYLGALDPHEFGHTCVGNYLTARNAYEERTGCSIYGGLTQFDSQVLREFSHAEDMDHADEVDEVEIRAAIAVIDKLTEQFQQIRHSMVQELS